MSHATSRSASGTPAAESVANKEASSVGDSSITPPSKTESGECCVNSESGTKKAAALAKIYQPISNPLLQVDALLRSELQSETPFVDQLLEHSRLLGGKRMRPVLLLLSAGSCGPISPAHITMATALEMIHLATLIHDDVIDESETRRHRPTAHQKWGNKTSVLLGDYLFTHSFSLASKANSVPALRMLATASNRVCEGEMKQNFWQGKFELSEADYLQMIGEKTGELCSVACGIGAELSNTDPNTVSQFEQFGRDLGSSFQIIDDVLDLVGDTNTVGKTLGTDLINQKPTLPVIHALRTLGDSERDSLLKTLSTGDVDVGDKVIPILQSTGSIDYSRQTAASLARNSIEFAESLVNKAESDETRSIATSLAQIGQFILSRTF